MPTLELTSEQVVDLVKQLSPDRQREALFALATGADRSREARMAYAQQQIRRVAAERGYDWDSMTEEERDSFIDDLLHED